MPVRPLGAVRAGWGALQLVAPGLVAGRLGLEMDHRARVVARVLAARQLVQAAVTAAVPTAEVRRLGIGVDALHAASMVALATVDSRRRKIALADAVVAIAFAISGRMRDDFSRGWRKVRVGRCHGSSVR